ncbi:lipid IV(A) 3-deoxy-D-manno-octulosonic acid transferase [Thiohalobacter sp.]|uniref:lipid IV(A) 3-deoxy-D-manno-octulosonic acid transferase n=1 Tax=Thiohalobacter sp. TaxID=2025948 RepID=UPI002633775B|nr:lipid IV(A) 3-deoxy-D-manno-octulosonic acid transferase [Thiohalobacter sp.]
MRRLYTLILYLALPLVFARLTWRSLRAPAYRQRWGERLGRGPALPGRPLWIHAVSVGEVQAAEPIVRALLERHPELPVLITTTTPTGCERVRLLFGDRVRHRYLPYDLPGAVARFLDAVQPRLGLVMETEIWPNLFAATAARGIPVILANARLSARSARGYRRLAGLTRDTLRCLAGIAAQSQADADRFRALGASPDVLQVLGNTKFDVGFPASLREQAEGLRAAWGRDRPVWVAGSTHEGEEEEILAAHRRLLQRHPDALLVLVPRHPERFDSVAERLQGGGWQVARRSAQAPVTRDTQVHLGDTMGELPLLYAAGDLAFVGGTLVPVGGHNPLEPAALGRPVLFGPHRFNSAEISRLLLEAGAAFEVQDADSLAERLRVLFSDVTERNAVGERGAEVVAANRGARDRLLAWVEGLLGRA